MEGYCLFINIVNFLKKAKISYIFGRNLRTAGLVYISFTVFVYTLTIIFSIIQYRYYLINLFYLLFCVGVSIWVIKIIIIIFYFKIEWSEFLYGIF